MEAVESPMFEFVCSQCKFLQQEEHLGCCFLFFLSDSGSSKNVNTKEKINNGGHPENVFSQTFYHHNTGNTTTIVFQSLFTRNSKEMDFVQNHVNSVIST